MFTTSSLKGVWSALQIPWDKHYQISYSALAESLAVLINSKVDGIYSCGTAGEFYNLTEDEFDNVQAYLADACRSVGMPFQIGASHMSPVIMLDRIRRSKSLHPQAFQVILPDWLKLNERECRSVLEKLEEEAAPIPLVLYNPSHAKNCLNPKQIWDLVKDKHHLIGLKNGLFNRDYEEYMRILNQHVAVFMPGHYMATSIINGWACGSYSNVACIDPNGAKIWYELIQNDPAAGLEAEQQIQSFFKDCIFPFSYAGYCDAALDKLLSAIGGHVDVGLSLRWPHQDIEHINLFSLKEAAKKKLPEFFKII